MEHFRKEESHVATIKTKARTMAMAFERSFKHARKTCGGVINAMQQLGFSDVEIVQRLRKDRLPRRLLMGTTIAGLVP